MINAHSDTPLHPRTNAGSPVGSYRLGLGLTVDTPHRRTEAGESGEHLKVGGFQQTQADWLRQRLDMGAVAVIWRDAERRKLIPVHLYGTQGTGWTLRGAKLLNHAAADRKNPPSPNKLLPELIDSETSPFLPYTTTTLICIFLSGRRSQIPPLPLICFSSCFETTLAVCARNISL